jgi:hypothetical protein
MSRAAESMLSALFKLYKDGKVGSSNILPEFREHPRLAGAEYACHHLARRLTIRRKLKHSWSKPKFPQCILGCAGGQSNVLLCGRCQGTKKTFTMYRTLGELTPAERERSDREWRNQIKRLKPSVAQ